MTKRLLLILIVTLAITAGHTSIVSSQEDQSAAKALEARQVAAAKQAQAIADQTEKFHRDQLEQQRKTSEANLDKAVTNLNIARASANETRFAQMQTSASLLLSLSQKVHGELQAGGAQTIPVFFFKDLDEIEKQVKTLRKTAK